MITETSEKLARPLIYVIAGEVSGDIIGARLIRDIKRLQKHKFSFAGVGGEQMTNEGVQSLFQSQRWQSWEYLNWSLTCQT